MYRHLLLSAALLFSSLTMWAGDLAFRTTTDKETGLYKPGEKMTFRIQLLEDSKPVAGKKLNWKRTGDDGKTENGDAMSSEAEPLSITTILEKPGFVRIEVTALDENGQPLSKGKYQPIKFDGGAAVEPEKLESFPEPKDFDAFWERQKAELAKVPMKFTLTELPAETTGWKSAFVSYDVKIDCAGGKPVYGTLTMPKKAEPKSLKAQFSGAGGYGVGSGGPSYVSGAITFGINAHGIENGKDAEFYKQLAAGELKNYAFNNTENANPETAYFHGMFLRILRALEFYKEYLKTHPEWNGKDLIATGASQGGFAAIAAAALDKDITECRPTVPWCCDLAGPKFGRLKGWHPDYTDALGYYDSVNMAKRIKCPVFIAGGLGDYTCAPSGLCVLYNNIKAPKQLELTQGWTHFGGPPNQQKITLKSN